jgi:hypothetical protein
MMRVLFLLTAILVPGEAFADDDPIAAKKLVEGRKASEDKPVCRTERSISSRVVKRVCKTDVQRLKEELDARAVTRLSGRKNQMTDVFKPPKGD